MSGEKLSLSTLLKSFSAQEEGYDESSNLLGGEIDPYTQTDNVEQGGQNFSQNYFSQEDKATAGISAQELLKKFEKICQESSDVPNGQIAFIDLGKQNGLIDDTSGIEPREPEIE